MSLWAHSPSVIYGLSYKSSVKYVHQAFQHRAHYRRLNAITCEPEEKQLINVN